MSKLKRCPLCGEGIMYEIQREDEIGRIIPQLFCNSCKMIFEVENDSPYMSDEKTLEYLEEKLLKTFNTRKPMDRIVERLDRNMLDNDDNNIFVEQHNNHYKSAIKIVKEEGGV